MEEGNDDDDNDIGSEDYDKEEEEDIDDTIDVRYEDACEEYDNGNY